MASTPPNEEAFLREVEEELRRDEISSFWKRWGRWLLAALVVGLVAFASYLWWQHEKTQKAEADGEAMVQILGDLEQGKQDGIEARLKPLAEGDNAGYRATAKLTLASLKLQKDDIKGAVAGYKSVADDTSLEQPFRDLALIRQTAAEYDTLKPDVVVARLKPLAIAGNPWLGSAGEMVAVAYLNQNKPNLAGPLFAAIAKDKGVPESIRSRAMQMAGVLGVDAVDQSTGDDKK